MRIAAVLAQASTRIVTDSMGISTGMVMDTVAVGTVIVTLAMGILSMSMVTIGPTGAGALLPPRWPRLTTAITRGTVMTVGSRTAYSALSPTIWFRAPISAMMAVAIRARD